MRADPQAKTDVPRLIAWESGVVATALFSAIFAGSCGVEAPEVKQPLQFSHASHEAEGLSCLDCHAGADRSPTAGLPAIGGCMLCHEKPRGKHQDEPKVRELAAKGEEIPWVKVNRNAGHVYFSHAAHVTLAAMECRDCHGDMKRREAPVTRPTAELHSMDECMACHEREGASNDCLRCHK